MTAPNTGEINPKDNAAHELRSYATGFVISLVLTVVADLTVAIGVGVALGLALRLRRRDVPASDWETPDR